MSTVDVAALRAEASLLPDAIPHEGVCASSLCEDCGHCLHSIADCFCPSCGCEDWSETEEVHFRRKVLALLDRLEAAEGAVERCRWLADAAVAADAASLSRTFGGGTFGAWVSAERILAALDGDR